MLFAPITVIQLKSSKYRAAVADIYRCTTDSGHDHPIAPNLLKQDFAAARPNMVWLADITYLPAGEGWLYLVAILDLATRSRSLRT